MFICVLLIGSFVIAIPLREEKQQRSSEILRDYRNGEITKEQGVEKLRDLSCEFARRSGVKYNEELC